MSENREQRKRRSRLSKFPSPIKLRSVGLKSTSKPPRFRNTIHLDEANFENPEVQSESVVFGKNVPSNNLQNQNANDLPCHYSKSKPIEAYQKLVKSIEICSKFVGKTQEFNNTDSGPGKSHSSSNGQIVSNSSSESESESINDSDNESQLNTNPTEDNEARQNAEIRQKSDEIKKLKLEIENTKKNHEQERAKDRENFEAVQEKNLEIRNRYEEYIANLKTEHRNEIGDLKGKLELQSANFQKGEKKLAQNADETKRRNLALAELQVTLQATLASILPVEIEVDEQ